MTDPSARDPLGLTLQALLNQPSPAADACLSLARQLYQARRFPEAEALSAHAVAVHPDARDLWNIRGVLLRMLRRLPEAIAALDQALRIDPAFSGAMINRGNVLLDLNQNEAALETFTLAVPLDHQGAIPRTMAGRALLRLGRSEDAIQHFRDATQLRADYVEAWQILVSALTDLDRWPEADTASAAALLANPDNIQLLETRSLLLRVSGRYGDAEAFLAKRLRRTPDAAWAHFHLGDLLVLGDPERAIGHLRRALALAPGQPDHAYALLRALGGSVAGDEGAKLDEAFALARQLAATGDQTPARTALLRDAFSRVCAFEDIAGLGSFESLGRSWAGTGLNASLMYHMAQANTPERARELVAQHRLWGEGIEAHAGRTPIPPVPLRTTGKVRLGFMSSDLRDHPVGKFALPLFDHIDRDRFEVFAYSFNRGEADPVQTHIAQQVDAFRCWPEITSREAARRIAEDQLDMLIELGGPTAMNLPQVMAWRPARLQASWLGYPHSTGLSAVDHYICDSFNAPTSPDLLIETPMLMPKSWIAMSRMLLASVPAAQHDLPERRRGYLTFGTANNPYKYTAEGLALWARVVAAVPGAHFAFIRPEAGSQAFRLNVEAAFALEGVTADRIEWHVTRGGHLTAYGDIDISLDTFPLTGGTTTVEALLMGVPVVSLAGEAFFQRLSRSILTNAGLTDLCADTPQAFEAIAVGLAANQGRRLALRRSLRARLEASPLGDAESFARDFYEMIHREIAPKSAPRTAD